MKNVIVILVAMMAVVIIYSAWAEEVEITTYYPAPMGTYKNLWAEEYYGYPQTPVDSVNLPDIYYGLDPISASVGIGQSATKDGSFLKQLYIGSGYIPTGSNAWPLDERVSLYVKNPSALDWNCGIYSYTTGNNSFGIMGRIGRDGNLGLGSVAVYGGNDGPGEAPTPDSIGYSCGVYGLTNPPTGNVWGVGVYGAANTPDSIGVYAENPDGRALIAMGKVGIGTENPNYKLEIEELDGANISLCNTDPQISAGDDLGTIYFRGLDSSERTGAMIRATSSSNWGSGVNEAGAGLKFFTQSGGSANSLLEPKMVITGGVGIGTDNPAGILDVQGGTAYGNASDINIYAANGGEAGYNTTGGDIILMPGAGYGTGRDGYVGIGTVDPQAKLEIDGAVRTQNIALNETVTTGGSAGSILPSNLANAVDGNDSTGTTVGFTGPNIGDYFYVRVDLGQVYKGIIYVKMLGYTALNSQGRWSIWTNTSGTSNSKVRNWVSHDRNGTTPIWWYPCVPFWGRYIYIQVDNATGNGTVAMQIGEIYAKLYE